MSNMICGKCQCKCLILPWDIIHGTDGRLAAMKIEDKPQIINMVNSFILIGTEEENGILGSDCFKSLCSNIIEAQKEASDYNEENIEDENTPECEEEREFWFYLDSKWKTFLKDMYFQSMYSAYLMYYYYVTGTASSTSSKDGDMETKRLSGVNDGHGSKNIEYGISQKKASSQLSIAKSYGGIFKREFMDKHRGEYCNDIEVDCSCGKSSCGSCGREAIPNRKSKIKAVVI